MKKKTILALVAGGILLAAAVLAGCWAWGQMNDYASVLALNWGIRLPAAARYAEEYAADSGASFQGDGLRYHVFSYREEAPVREMFSWQSAPGTTRYDGSYLEAAEKWLEQLAVPAAERPAYPQCQYRYARQQDGSELLMLWDPAAKRLYLLESFL